MWLCGYNKSPSENTKGHERTLKDTILILKDTIWTLKVTILTLTDTILTLEDTILVPRILKDTKHQKRHDLI